MKREVHRKRPILSDWREQKITDKKYNKRRKLDNDATLVKDHQGTNRLDGHQDQTIIPSRAKIHSILEETNHALKLLDNHVMKRPDPYYNFINLLTPERDVTQICKRIDEIISENVNSPDELISDILGNCSIQGIAKTSDENDANKCGINRNHTTTPIAINKPKLDPVEDYSYEEKDIDVDVNHTEDADVIHNIICSQDISEDTVMVPPMTKLKNTNEGLTPLYKQDDEICLHVETPLREEFDNEECVQKAKIYTPSVNHKETEEPLATYDTNPTKRLEINTFVNLRGLRSVIFKNTCRSFAQGRCKNSKCAFKHAFPDNEEVNSVLSHAKRHQIIDEYNAAQKIYQCKKKYVMCFVKECVNRQDIRLLLEITYDAIRRPWSDNAIINEVLNASLSELKKQTNFDAFEDILLLQCYIRQINKSCIFIESLILAIIRSDYDEMAEYETVLQKLLDIVQEKKSVFKIDIAMELLDKLANMTTFSPRMATIATTVFCNTNPSIFKTVEMPIFQCNLKRDHNKIFVKFEHKIAVKDISYIYLTRSPEP